MRIGLLVGSLGQGGAEGQLAELAAGLAAAGHVVEVMAYDGPGFHDESVRARGVPVRVHGARTRLEKIRLVREWMEEFRPDVTHGFMTRPSVLAVIATRKGPPCRVVVSDASKATYDRWKLSLWISLVVFGLADRVVTESETNRRSLALLAPWLGRKTVVVRNGVDTARFSLGRHSGVTGPFRFLSVGSVYGVKNPVRLVQAVGVLRDRGARPFRVDWVGRTGLGGRPSEEYLQAVTLVRELHLESVVDFRGPSDRIEDEYRKADALIHVSLREGIPNAVVEAMACGLPVVAGRVSDLPLIVEHAGNGFLCDQRDPEAIADAMERMLSAGDEERAAMGARSRAYAVEYFGRDRCTRDFERLYGELVGAW